MIQQNATPRSIDARWTRPSLGISSPAREVDLAQQLAEIESQALALQTLAQQLRIKMRQQAGQLDDGPRPVDPPPMTWPAAAPRGDDAAPFRIYCFGAFEVYRQDIRLLLRASAKGQAILKLLTVRPRLIQRDELIEMLWPETEPGVANNRLKVAIHHLRQVFAADDSEPNPEIVVFQNGGYALNSQLNIWTDVRAFELNWQRGLCLERAGQVDEAIPYYLQAESLYRGDLLEQDLYEEWLLARREGLKDIYLTLLDKLSAYWLKQNQVERAIEGWKKILVQDPLREDAYRHLIACFAQCGQRTLALRWYDSCVRMLHEQLEVEPEPETVALYVKIRDQARVTHPNRPL